MVMAAAICLMQAVLAGLHEPRCEPRCEPCCDCLAMALDRVIVSSHMTLCAVTSVTAAVAAAAVADGSCSYLQRRRNRAGPAFTYEVIIVDDGSKDNTARCVEVLCSTPSKATAT
jgi:cellulose synthase/poly-beta-1,6-N-acetylglucosamine synthase-like glycosyltransferase